MQYVRCWRNTGPRNLTVRRHPGFSNFQVLIYNRKTCNLIDILKKPNECPWTCPDISRPAGPRYFTVWRHPVFSNFLILIYNRRTFNLGLINILKKPNECPWTCPEIFRPIGPSYFTVWRHLVFSNFQVLAYNRRTFNLINILKHPQWKPLQFYITICNHIGLTCPGFCWNTWNMAAA